jgi:mRNA interferase HigB
MKIISLGVLRDYWVKRPDSQQPLQAWVSEVRHTTWMQPADIKATFRNASILKNRRVVFNIKGNDHRLVVAIAYRHQQVFIKFVGTHEEYDAIDASTIEFKE